MARYPFRIARQEHVGTALDDLVERGVVHSWRFEYDNINSRALFVVTTDGASEVLLTKEAEKFVQARYDELMVRWKAVPHPGSAKHLRETLAWIAEG